jgi:hypothetical protein
VVDMEVAPPGTSVPGGGRDQEFLISVHLRAHCE